MDAKRPRGVLKATPDCFVVQELVGRNATPVPLHEKSELHGWNGNDPFTVFHLTKKGYTTPDAVKEVARQLHVRIGDISFHGMKDRHAHTSQCIAVKGKFTPQFTHANIVLRQRGGSNRPLNPGSNVGNRFTISILSDAKSVNGDAMQNVRNIFGSQRFGNPLGHEVGRCLLEGDMAGAMHVLQTDRLRVQVERMKIQTGSWEEVLFHPGLKFEVGMRILQWQSFLWNRLITEFNDPLPTSLPMWQPHTEVSAQYQHLWYPENLEQRAVNHLHRFNRPTLVQPKNVRIMQRVIGWEIGFDLPSGSYATVVLSQVFDLDEQHLR